MKKALSFLFAFILLSVSSFANAAGGQNWYFSSKSQNDRPTLPSVALDSVKGIGPEEKVLYLTFDAGYENGNVEKIVNILKDNEVAGSFFLLRHFVEQNPDLTRAIKENGNLVCNHTATHKNITALSPEAIQSELFSLEEAVMQVTGEKPAPFFRPPEGAWSESALLEVEKLGYKTVFWSLAWADWDNNNQKSPEYAMEKLNSRVHDGAVILLHPTSETNTKILDGFIKAMKDKGYRFETVEALWQE